MIGFHHLRAREMVAKGIEPFPARDILKRYLDYTMYGISVLAPLALLPQIFSIYIDREKRGVSIETWILLSIFSILWTIYGVVHKDKPIIITHALFAILDISIVVGVLVY
jgi:MtN3 and saliva related transmembrane protein